VSSPSLVHALDLSSFRWSHEPRRWKLDSVLELTTDPDTDYWQRTHYGFQRDNGHFLYTTVEGDFSFTACFTGKQTAQYDQAGLLCRVDSDNWIKCSAEYETPALSRLGSVVTNLGFSDWASQDIPASAEPMHYKLDRQGNDFRVSWSVDGHEWRQMCICHLHACPAALQVGIYACSPTGPGFVCQVSDIVVRENDWMLNHD
jgi:uncharacterized protein